MMNIPSFFTFKVIPIRPTCFPLKSRDSRGGAASAFRGQTAGERQGAGNRVAWENRERHRRLKFQNAQEIKCEFS